MLDYSFMTPDSRNDARGLQDAAVKKLREAKTDGERQTAREALRKVLAQVFADDMRAREKQAAEIESRLAKLRQQYQEREHVKDRIIDLQLQVLEQEAAGLGFPGGPSTAAVPPTPVRGPSDTIPSRNVPVRRFRKTRSQYPTRGSAAGCPAGACPLRRPPWRPSTPNSATST
jgi:hypothetical protein